MTLTQALKSKTLWFSVGLAALGALETQIKLIPDEYQGQVLILIATVSATLRYLTTQPLSEK